MSGQVQTLSSTAPTQVESQSSPPAEPEQLVLRLGPHKEKGPRVKWDASVKDSRPTMKTSKKCCVFHKRKEFGESDSGMCAFGLSLFRCLSQKKQQNITNKL